MKSRLALHCLVWLSLSLGAGAKGWEPAAPLKQVPLWTHQVPDAQPAGPTETAKIDTYLCVEHVSRPTLTVYPPKGANTGVAVLVFPGGGYQILAMDLEGTEPCDWLNSLGITAVLVKYRVPHSGEYWDPQLHRHVTPKKHLALEDGQRALSLVRLHAAEWHIDPHKIGVLGFSAGGHIVAALSTHFGQRSYPAADAADRVSCRPDFAIAAYPGHLSRAENSVALNPDIDRNITARTPPTFLIQNEDDHVDRVEDALSYYVGLKRAGVPVEMHLYAKGGHAFGVRPSKNAVSGWTRLVETWLKSIGMLTNR